MCKINKHLFFLIKKRKKLNEDMIYPCELLPKENYTIIKTENLPDNCCLIRRSLKDKDYTFDNMGEVRIDAICNTEDEHDMYGLSNNLLSIFKRHHINYRVLTDEHKNNAYWNEGDSTPAIVNIKFEYLQNNPPIFFKVNELHDKDFPYEPPLKNKNNTNKTNKIIGKCKVIHKPTKCNYWHFELNFFDVNETLIKKTSSVWKIEAAKFFIKTYLIMNIYSEITEEIQLEENVYTRT